MMGAASMSGRIVAVAAASAVALPILRAGAAGPSGPQTLVDDTDLLTVTVPAGWVDTNTSPGLHDDGTDRATITASPSIPDFLGGFGTDGVRLVAFPPTVRPATLIENNNYASNCTDGGATPWDNGRFAGEIHTWTGCGEAGSRLIHVAARPPDDSFTAFAEIQVTTADDTALDLVLESLAVVEGSTYRPPPPAAPPTPTAAVDPQLLQGPVQKGATTLTDDTERLSVAVPGDWIDIDLQPSFNDDMTRRPRIQAAADLDGMYSSWGVPGVIVTVFPFGDQAALLDNLGWPGDCTDGGLQSFDNGAFTGYLRTWSNCGRTQTRIVAAAVSPPDQSAVVYLEAQLPTIDDTALRTVLASLTLI